MTLESGDRAPEFTLRDQNGQPVSLSSFRGRKHVLLVFFPLAFSRICQGELCSIRDDLPRFSNDEVQILGISVDSTYSLKAWADREGFTFPLLADFWPHGAVARAYGVFEEGRGHALRGTFLIDKDGVVRWMVVHQRGEARDQSQYVRALAEIGVGALGGVDTPAGQVSSARPGA